MKLYIDMCALKRPFDDRSQPRVESEASAILDLLGRIMAGEHSLVWSPALTFENEADPDLEVREAITRLSSSAAEHVSLTVEVRQRIADLHDMGIAPLDAAHLACAEAALCHSLITCDDRFQKRAARIRTLIKVVNPLQFTGEYRDG